MFISPKQVKYKKTRKGRLSKYEFKANSLKFGIIGLKAVEAGLINTKQIEAARQAVVRKTKRRGKIWVRIFPNISITSKPIGVRMGKGKGQVSHWAAKVKGGTMIFEICGLDNNIALTALKAGSAKLPIKTKIIT